MKVRTRLLLSLTGDLGDSAFGDEGFDSPAKYNIIIAGRLTNKRGQVEEKLPTVHSTRQ